MRVYIEFLIPSYLRPNMCTDKIVSAVNESTAVIILHSLKCITGLKVYND